MNYIFFGTPKFASLLLLRFIGLTGIYPSAIICNPDRPTGRKRQITPPPIKAAFQEISPQLTRPIEILQPENVSLIKDKIALLKPDVALVASYGKILPPAIIETPRLHTLGVHPSLLPRYRGPTPIQAAILASDAETGLTVYRLDEKVDHGPILAKQGVSLKGDETYEQLTGLLAVVGGKLLADTLPRYLKGNILLEAQNDTLATYTKKFKNEDGYIKCDELKRAEEEGGEIAVAIERQIRALNPEPGVWTEQNGKRLKLLKSKLEGNKLKLTMIQFEGQKPKKI